MVIDFIQIIFLRLIFFNYDIVNMVLKDIGKFQVFGYFKNIRNQVLQVEF